MRSLGWVYQPQAIDEFTNELARRSPSSYSFAAALPALSGYGRGKNVFQWRMAQQLFGNPMPPYSQQRGICVGCGTARAIQNSLWSQILKDNDLLLTGTPAFPFNFALEFIYGMSRAHPQLGNGALGASDGSTGAWAAQCVHDFGVPVRQKYSTVDLTLINERIACDVWGIPGGYRQIPKDIFENAFEHPVEACHRCLTGAEIRDAVAAGYGVALCLPKYATDRDARGMSRLNQIGGHCTAVDGCFVDDRGNECFTVPQSWGGLPRGPLGIFLKSGERVVMPVGTYGCYLQEVDSLLRQGEAWAFGEITGDRPNTVTPGEFL